MKYTIDEIEKMIMDAEILIPIECFFDKNGQHITKKEYGIILLKQLCKELKENHNKLIKGKQNDKKCFNPNSN